MPLDGCPATAHAQAKVNLGLRILGREPDGFHALETIFHQLELADEVRVAFMPAERILVCKGPAMPPAGLGPGPANLAWRAADAYLAAAGLRCGFEIELVKHVPTGGGLGGGSSDAGAVLRACDRLAGDKLGEARLHEIAATLGSDVPFLAGESPAAIGRGRGELLEPVSPLPQRDVALVFPRFGVPTADAYRWLAASRGSYEMRGGALRAADATWDSIARDSVNDFESLVGARHPVIPQLIDRLRTAGAMVAMMSGSGSTVFGVFEPGGVPAAREALHEVPGGATIVWTKTARRVVPVVVGG